MRKLLGGKKSVHNNYYHFLGRTSVHTSRVLLWLTIVSLIIMSMITTTTSFAAQRVMMRVAANTGRTLGYLPYYTNSPYKQSGILGCTTHLLTLTRDYTNKRQVTRRAPRLASHESQLDKIDRDARKQARELTAKQSAQRVAHSKNVTMDEQGFAEWSLDGKNAKNVHQQLRIPENVAQQLNKQSSSKRMDRETKKRVADKKKALKQRTSQSAEQKQAEEAIPRNM
jgi:hypothetical protein